MSKNEPLLGEDSTTQDFSLKDQMDQYTVSVDPSVLNEAISSFDTTERFD